MYTSIVETPLCLLNVLVVFVWHFCWKTARGMPRLVGHNLRRWWALDWHDVADSSYARITSACTWICLLHLHWGMPVHIAGRKGLCSNGKGKSAYYTFKRLYTVLSIKPESECTSDYLFSTLKRDYGTQGTFSVPMKQIHFWIHFLLYLLFKR